MPGNSNKFANRGDIERRLIPYPEARALLGDIGRTKFHAVINSGQLVRVSIGRRAFITAESLDAYVDSLIAAAR